MDCDVLESISSSAFSIQKTVSRACSQHILILLHKLSQVVVASPHFAESGLSDIRGAGTVLSILLSTVQLVDSNPTIIIAEITPGQDSKVGKAVGSESPLRKR